MNVNHCFNLKTWQQETSKTLRESKT